MAVIETWYNQDLSNPVQVQYLHGNVFSQDNGGNLIGVNVYQDGQPATLSGSVSGLAIRADGATVAITNGTLSGNRASVILPAACYAVPGVISVVVKLTSGETVTTLCAVVTNVYQSSTDTAVDPGTIIPDITALITAVDNAVASIPADYSSLVKDVKAINDEINGKVFNFAVDSVGGWVEKIIVPNMALKKDDYITIEATFTPSVSVSTYIYLRNGDAEISHTQVNGLSAKTITYKATADMNQFRVTTNSTSYTGRIDVKLTVSSRQTAIEENHVTSRELAKENPGYFSLQRLSPFVRGGYDYPNFNWNSYQISSAEVMTAPFPVYIKIKPGFHAKFLIIVDGSVTDSGWQTYSYYIPKGTQFVAKIERATPDTSETVDIDELLSGIVVYSDFVHWYEIKRFADDVTTGQRINLATGELQSSSTYFFLFSFKNPKFKFIKLDASLYDRELAGIAFYSTETISTGGYISGANQGAWIEHNYIYAEVPDNCKLVCVSSRNVYGNDTPHNIGIYVDDATGYIENEIFYKLPPLTLFKDFKYVYHFNANRLGTSDVPLNSLHDIDVAHRLGFKAYEINAHETATPGYYVCFHGNGGKIGSELVARDGTDISDIPIGDVTRQTFEEDYVYNTPVPELRTPVTSLDAAIKACRKYGMFPIISRAGYQSLYDYQKLAGNDYAVIIYNTYYLGRSAYKGAYVLYQTLTDAEFSSILASSEKPFIFNFTTDDLHNLTTAQMKARIQACRENNCLIGAAGVYQTSAENMALFDMGVDYLASGWEVEDFTDGNLLSIGAFSDFTHTGTVSGGVLSLTNGGTIQPPQVPNCYLSKGALRIRFSGTLVFNFGDYITNESVESDGAKDVLFTTAFYKATPTFTATANGNVTIYECVYDASVC